MTWKALYTHSCDVILRSFSKHASVNISSGSTRLIRRKCSLIRSKCVRTNHMIVYSRFCFYINLTPRGAGLSPRDINCFCLIASFTYDIEERGRVSRTFPDWIFTRDVLFRKREDLQNFNRAPESPEDISLADSIDLHSNVSHCDISGKLRRNWTGFSDAFKLTKAKLVWTVTLLIIIGR